MKSNFRNSSQTKSQTKSQTNSATNSLTEVRLRLQVWAVIGALVLVIAGVAGCGQKGPLVLPEPATPAEPVPSEPDNK